MLEKTNVWWVQCKPFCKEERDSEKARLFQKECILKRFFGIGWDKKEITEPHSGEPICPELVELFRKAIDNKSFSQAQNLFAEMQIGDIVFSRLNDQYFLGVIEKGPYVTVEHTDLLTWQGEVSEWINLGASIDLPHHVRGQISSANYHNTVTKVDGFARLTLLYLVGRRSEKRVSMSVNDFYLAMNDEDLEDLMGYYMSVKEPEYVLLPSSCKKNTPGIEFVMYNPKDGSEIACQTKVNNAINVASYLDESYEKYKHIYLFSGKGYEWSEKRNDNQRVIIVEKTELYDALRKNIRLLSIIQEYFVCTDEPLKEVAEQIPRNVYEFVLRWINGKKGDLHIEEKLCDGKYIRYTTELTSAIFPEADKPLSGWKTNSHYFYEIIYLKSQKRIVFQLALSLHNIPDDLFVICNKINMSLTGQELKRRQKWVVPYVANSIDYVGMTLNSFVDELENRYNHLRKIEKQLIDGINA